MNQGAKYTFLIAAVLFGAAVFPLLAVAASLILVGMALHSILSAPRALSGYISETASPAEQIEHQEAEKLIRQMQKQLDE